MTLHLGIAFTLPHRKQEGDGFPLVASVVSNQAVRCNALPMSGGDRRRYLSLIRGETRGLWPLVQRAGLRLASIPYGVVLQLRNLAFANGWLRNHRAAVPVVSVGNLTAGGTGKTPCVEYVVRFYREHRRPVRILSRGYGNEGGPNDEALVLEKNLPDVPHLQGADRVELARTALDKLGSEL